MVNTKKALYPSPKGEVMKPHNIHCEIPVPTDATTDDIARMVKTTTSFSPSQITPNRQSKTAKVTFLVDAPGDNTIIMADLTQGFGNCYPLGRWR